MKMRVIYSNSVLGPRFTGSNGSFCDNIAETYEGGFESNYHVECC